MATETTTWIQKTRETILASKALPYIMEVVDGQETEPDKIRLDSCHKLLNKVMPDLKAIQHAADADSTFEFHAHIHGKG